jgi:hypothetical protein
MDGDKLVPLQFERINRSSKRVEEKVNAMLVLNLLEMPQLMRKSGQGFGRQTLKSENRRSMVSSKILLDTSTDSLDVSGESRVFG